MNAMLIDAVGRTLMHFLWEGAALALLLALFARASARVRYGAACTILAAMPLAFAATLARLWQTPVGFPHRIAWPTAAAGISPGDGLAALAAPTPGLWQWLVPLWMAGVAVFYLRNLGGWMAARRLRTAGVRPAAPEWQERMRALCVQLGVRRAVGLMESCLAEVPVVIGYLRPVILLPMGLVTGMPAEQVEALLIHELAHIRRHDYLVNLLQRAVEGLLFYHPAVWWVSHVIRTEREHCCDDAVVTLRGDAHGYARALATLETARVPEPLLAASGGSLLGRVRRLLGQQEGPQGGAATFAAGLMLAMAAATMLTAWQQAPAPKPAPTAQPEPAAAQPQPARRTYAQAEPKQPRRSAQPAGTPYERWLEEDVVYIITPEEREAFGNLRTDDEREHFIEQFWDRRDPTPGTPENEFKEEYYRRIAYANEHFSTDIAGWKTDAGRYYITFGPPDEKESHPNEGYEIWRYRHLDGIGENIAIHIDLSRRMLRQEPEKHAVHQLPVRGVAAHLDGAPFFDHVDSNGDSVYAGQRGSAVAVGTSGTVEIRVDTGAHAGEASNLTGRITTSGRRLVATFEAKADGPAWNRQTRLAPGIYRLNTVRRNVVSGDQAADEVYFQVK
jgi:GWxTD domain-containing protein